MLVNQLLIQWESNQLRNRLNKLHDEKIEVHIISKHPKLRIQILVRTHCLIMSNRCVWKYVKNGRFIIMFPIKITILEYTPHKKQVNGMVLHWRNWLELLQPK